MSNLTKNGKGRGCLILFGLIFFVAGLVPGWIGYSMISQSIQARSWTPVEATILSTNLDSSTDDEGSTTYSVSGRFSYRWQGRTLTHDQVSFDAGSDNIGSFHQDAYSTLSEAKQAGQTLTAWVDPDNPERAVIFRDIRWGMVLFLFMFTLVFSGVGAGIMLFSIIGGRKLKQRTQKIQKRKAAMGYGPLANQSDERHSAQDPMMAQRQAASGLSQATNVSEIPVEPWELAFPSNELSCGSKSMMWFFLVFAIFWNLISLPVWFFIPEQVANGDMVALLAFLFPLVGAGLAFAAGYQIVKHRKYGRGTLTLSTFPAHPGGVLKGRLIVPRDVQAEEFDVTLNCLSRRTSGSGKNRRTRESSIWQDQTRVSIQHYGDEGCSASIRMSIPKDARPSTSFSGEDGILWQVSLSAQCPGVDFSQSYNLPVIAGVTSAMDDDLMDALSAPFQSDLDSEATLDGGDWRATGVIHELGSSAYQFPGYRSITGTLITAVMALVFGGIGVGTGIAGEWFFSVIFGLVGLGIGAVCYYMLCKTRLEVDSAGLRRARGIVRLGRGRYWRRDAIDSVKVAVGGSVNNRQFYRIMLTGNDKKKHSLVGMLPNKRDAHALAQRFVDTLNLG